MSVPRTNIARRFFELRRTIADELKEEGSREGVINGSRRNLVRLLKRRFGDVPAAVSATIRATDALEQLDEWLDRLVVAESVEDVGIGAPA